MYQIHPSIAINLARSHSPVKAILIVSSIMQKKRTPLMDLSQLSDKVWRDGWDVLIENGFLSLGPATQAPRLYYLSDNERVFYISLAGDFIDSKFVEFLKYTIEYKEPPTEPLLEVPIMASDLLPSSKPKKKTDVIKDEPYFYSATYLEKYSHLYPTLLHTITNAMINRGAEEIRKLIRLDGWNFDDIKEVCEWAITDSFWGGNVRSLGSLRKRGSNGMMKIENIRASMSRQPSTGSNGNSTIRISLNEIAENFAKSVEGIRGSDLSDHEWNICKDIEQGFNNFYDLIPFNNSVELRRHIISYKTFVFDYLDYLDRQSKFDNASPNMFKRGSSVWNKFVGKMGRDIGWDLRTGKRTS